MKKLFIILFLLIASPVWPAVTFNGSSQALQIANVDLSGVQAVSVSLWYWVDTWPAGDNALVEFSSNYNGVTTGFLVDPNFSTDFYVNLNGDVGLNTATYDVDGLTTGAWHHYLFLFDKSQAANEVDTYIDGSLQTPTRSTNNNTNNFAQDTLNLMARDGGNGNLFAAGRLADVAVWNMRLSGGNATSLAAGTLPSAIEAANLKGYWKLCTNSTPTTDSSGAGHNGTLIGSPTQSTHPAAITASCTTATPSPIVVNFQ